MDELERVIDLKDFLESACRRWRFILAFMLGGVLIGAVVSLGFAYYNRNSATDEAKKISAAKAVAKAEKELNKEENADDLKETADNFLKSYSQLYNLYQLQEDYMEESIYYNINDQEVYETTLTYYINNHYQVTYPIVESYNNIDDIVSYYSLRISDDSFTNQILKQVYPDSQNKYIRELFTVENPSKGCIMISIVADTEDNSQAMKELTKKEMETITEEALTAYGDVECTLQMEQSSKEKDLTVATNHKDTAQKFEELYESMQTVKDSMSGTQLEYFEAKLVQMKMDKASEETTLPSLGSYISKKKIAIGGALGLILALVIVGCGYLFSNRINTEYDLILGTQSLVIANLNVKDRKDKNSIDRLIRRIFHGKQETETTNKIKLAANMISETRNQKNIYSLCIISSVNISNIPNISELLDMLMKKQIEVTYVDCFLTNEDGLRFTNQVDAVLICEVVKESMLDDVVQLKKILNLNDVQILGCLALS